MWQWDQVERATLSAHLENAPYNFIEFLEGDKLRDRQFANGNNETRLKDCEFVVHPRRAIADLHRVRNPIRAAAGFPGKTATDSGEVNARTHLPFIHSAKFFEPAKERLPGRMRERSLECRLTHAGRLADDHHIAHDWSARNGRRHHARTTAALHKARDVPREAKFGLCANHLFLLDNSDAAGESVD